MRIWCRGLAIAAGLLLAPAMADSERPVAAVVRQAQAMSAARDPAESERLESKLPELLAKVHAGDIDAGDIASVTHLLSDKDDRVRYWMAQVLSLAGPAALAAAPALRQALQRVNCSSDLTSEGPILTALARIGAPHAVSPCGTGMENMLIRTGVIPAEWGRRQ